MTNPMWLMMFVILLGTDPPSLKRAKNLSFPYDNSCVGTRVVWAVRAAGFRAVEVGVDTPTRRLEGADVPRTASLDVALVVDHSRFMRRFHCHHSRNVIPLNQTCHRRYVGSSHRVT